MNAIEAAPLLFALQRAVVSAAVAERLALLRVDQIKTTGQEFNTAIVAWSQLCRETDRVVDELLALEATS